MFDGIPSAEEARKKIEDDITMRREDGMRDFHSRIAFAIREAIADGEHQAACHVNTNVWRDEEVAGRDMRETAKSLELKGYFVSIIYNINNGSSHRIEISWKD